MAPSSRMFLTFWNKLDITAPFFRTLEVTSELKVFFLEDLIGLGKRLDRLEATHRPIFSGEYLYRTRGCPIFSLVLGVFVYVSLSPSVCVCVRVCVNLCPCFFIFSFFSALSYLSQSEWVLNFRSCFFDIFNVTMCNLYMTLSTNAFLFSFLALMED